MKVLVLTSNSNRHKYFATVACENFDCVGVVTEPKSNYFDKQREESELVRVHFKRLSEYEQKYFKEYSQFPKTDVFEIEKKNINDEASLQWCQEKNPEIILLFGTEILGDHWLNSFENKIINLHLGLSPYYRGAATLFWPFYHHELHRVGVTYHLATADVDGGAIIKTIRPELSVGDNYYDITNKAIKTGINSLPEAMSEYQNNHDTLSQQMITEDCHYYKKTDFNEDVLRQVLDEYGSGLEEKDILTK